MCSLFGSLWCREAVIKIAQNSVTQCKLYGVVDGSVGCRWCMVFAFAHQLKSERERESESESKSERQRQHFTTTTKNEKDYVIKSNYFNECNLKWQEEGMTKFRMREWKRSDRELKSAN